MRRSKPMGNYICPTCGYSNLERPAWNPDNGAPSYDICPSCGCEFGYDDAKLKARENYREKWIRQGAPWFKPELKPNGWSLKQQLLLIGIDLNNITQ
jgi:hypothetical protein